jgi:NAD-dependent dihydropyrimidine dehydrogenase PreA subunit
MRIGIFYFTGTGNTEFIAREFGRAFGPEHPAELHSIETLPTPVTPELLAPYDLLMFGAPVLALNPPRHFIRFLRRLPEGRGRRAVVHLNAGGERFADIGYASSILKRRGYSVVGEYFFLTPANLLLRRVDALTGDLHFAWFGGGYRQNGPAMFAACREDVHRAAEEILAGQSRRARFGLPARAVFVAVRGVFYGLACNLFKLQVHATSDCNACGLCVQSCPTRNIRMKRGRPWFGSSCTVCYRCLNVCPRRAIRFRWPLGALGNSVPYLSPGWTPPRHRV